MKKEIRDVMEKRDVKEESDMRIIDVSIACKSQLLRSVSTAKREVPLYVYPLT